MDQSQAKFCHLCDKTIENDGSRYISTVRDKGIRSLIKTSLKRKDNKHKFLSKVSILRVHRSCYVIYNRERSIRHAVRITDPDRSPPRKGAFTYRRCCIFCTNDIEKENSSKIVKIQNANFKTKLLSDIDNRPPDEFNRLLRKRLDSVDDLVKIRAVYHKKCYSRFYDFQVSGYTKSDPDSKFVDSAVIYIIKYLLTHREDSQFSLRDILKNFGKTSLPLDIISEKLDNHFGSDIICYTSEKDTIVCFRDTRVGNLTGEWYRNCLENPEEERCRIVEMAANIVLQDIRTVYYDSNKINSLKTSSLTTLHSEIPESLKKFLDIIIKSHISNEENASNSKWDDKVSTIAHMLISPVRSKTFMSSLLMNLSLTIQQHKSTKNLIDNLAYLGLCAPYNTLKKFNDTASVELKTENIKELSDASLENFCEEDLNEQENGMMLDNDQNDEVNITLLECIPNILY